MWVRGLAPPVLYPSPRAMWPWQASPFICSHATSSTRQRLLKYEVILILLRWNTAYEPVSTHCYCRVTTDKTTTTRDFFIYVFSIFFIFSLVSLSTCIRLLRRPNISSDLSRYLSRVIHTCALNASTEPFQACFDLVFIYAHLGHVCYFSPDTKVILKWCLVRIL